jgi:hypothetical protein
VRKRREEVANPDIPPRNDLVTMYLDRQGSYAFLTRIHVRDYEGIYT